MSSKDQPNSPRLKANFLSRLFFCWLSPIFRKGYKKDLEFEDLYKVLNNDQSVKLGNELASLWEEECASIYMKNDRSKNTSKKLESPKLRRPLLRQFGWSYMFCGLLAFMEECVIKICQPLCLGFLIRYFENREATPVWHGILFALGVTLSSFFYTSFHHPYFFGVQHIGMQMRIATGALIYRKSLKLSQNSLSGTTIGQMVNLIANDVNRFDTAAICVHFLWIGPVQTIIVLIILWHHYGPSCLVGLSVFILFVPFQAFMGSHFSKLREVSTMKTDKRIRLMNEIVNGMRVIKLYAWEFPFSDLVNRARTEEVKLIRKISFLRAINISLFHTSSKVIIFLTLLTYVLTDHTLTAEKVFVTLALYNNVRLVMTMFFPTAVSQLAEINVSIHRLEKFLLMEEMEKGVLPPPPGHVASAGDSGNQKNGVWIENLTSTWAGSAGDTLKNLTFQCEAGELVGIIGPVGSGKSSLLQAILGELPAKKLEILVLEISPNQNTLIDGAIYVRGKIGYASQEPIIFAGSVIDNILFGREYEPVWYENVCSACALTRDFEIFPYGDRTLCGEKGSALSGGQKARINLARTVYGRADIYLLDDPLSAVDSEVGRHLFEECINGILKNKTRILVTHQIQFLKDAQNVIIFNHGEIQAQGDIEALTKSGIDINVLLKAENELKPVELALREPSVVKKGQSSSSGVYYSPSPSIFSIQRRPSLPAGENSFTGNLVLYEEIIESESEHVFPLTPTTPKHPKHPEKEKKKGKDTRGNPVLLDEQRSIGTIPISIYWTYFSAGTGCCFLTFFITIQIVTQIFYTGSDYWLNFWSKAEEKSNGSTITNYDHDDVLEVMKHDRKVQLIIYSTIIGALLISAIIRTICFFAIVMQSSSNLHNRMFNGIIRAPMRFFDLNPIGRILNRIAKDINLIDDNIPITFFDVLEIYLGLVGIIFLISIVNAYLLIPAAILTVFLWILRRYYIRTSRSVKRLESISKSPVLSHLNATLNGLVTIRAYQVEGEFSKQFDDLQDLHTSSYYLFIATSRWFGIRLDWISLILIIIVTFSFFIFTTGAPEVGMAISAVIQLSGFCQWGIRQSAELENQMVSVERILEYTKLEPEKPLDSQPGNKPAHDWPSKGEIYFTEVVLRYGNEEPVLKQISFRVRPSEKVGIVGRTGAGKSSLITALFRIAEPDGIIKIDGVDVGQIGLHDLRSKISIIPQEPVLFSGSLRMNLDPFGASTDDEIWKVLEDIHLLQSVQKYATGLNFEVAEGGTNFSVGQRQLICLGRAILKKNKILVLDEATANVDQETDSLIQKTIRVQFLHCTVLTVAHRLNTVMDSDRILVLDAGKVKEFDEPYKLLMSKYSALSDFVEQTGPENSLLLRKLAKVARDKRKRALSHRKDNITDISTVTRTSENPSAIEKGRNDDGGDTEKPSSTVRITLNSPDNPDHVDI